MKKGPKLLMLFTLSLSTVSVGSSVCFAAKAKPAPVLNTAGVAKAFRRFIRIELNLPSVNAIRLAQQPATVRPQGNTQTSSSGSGDTVIVNVGGPSGNGNTQVSIQSGNGGTGTGTSTGSGTSTSSSGSTQTITVNLSTPGGGHQADGPSETDIGETESNIMKSLAHGGLKLVGEGAQTSLVLVMLGTVGAIQSEVEHARLRGETIGPEKMTTIAVMVLEHVFSSGSVYSGFAGGTLMGIGAKYIARLAENAAARSLLVKLLSSGAVSLFVNLGWELCSELFEQARNMFLIDPAYSPEEQKKNYDYAENIPRMTIAAMGFFYGADEIRRARYIFPRLIKNIGIILFLNKDLRHHWLYNAWRNRIATGDFVIMTVALAAAGTVVFPGVGTVAGLALGLGVCFAAGLIAMEVPQPIKDQLTLGLKEYRVLWNQAGSWINEHRLRSNLNDPVALQGVLKSRMRRRELLINPYIEALTLMQMRVDNLEAEIAIAQQTLDAQRKKAAEAGQSEWSHNLKRFGQDMFAATSGPIGMQMFASLETTIAVKKEALSYYRSMKSNYAALVPFAYQNELQLIFELKSQATGLSKILLEHEYANLKLVDQGLQSWTTGVDIPDNLRPTRAFEEKVKGQFDALQALPVASGEEKPAMGDPDTTAKIANQIYSDEAHGPVDPLSLDYKRIRKATYISLLEWQSRAALVTWNTSEFKETAIVMAMREQQKYDEEKAKAQKEAEASAQLKVIQFPVKPSLKVESNAVQEPSLLTLPQAAQDFLNHEDQDVDFETSGKVKSQ